MSTRFARPRVLSPEPGGGPPGGIRRRKSEHVEICTDTDSYTVEVGPPTGFEELRFVHQALPELDEASVDTRVRFLGHELAMPAFISCMTGGSAGGFAANRELAKAAQAARVPVGLGSIRVLFDEPSLFDHFHVKPSAPDVPVFANLGAVQIRDLPHPAIFEMLRRLEVQALVVHLNPAQELFQPEGDRDFRGIERAIARLCEASPLPVIVKETGFGIAPQVARRLFACGVSYVDVAGAGGTNWVRVESYRLPEAARAAARVFDSWGIPTAVALAALARYRGRVLASGGLRSGVDVAKSMALGAELAGFALPVIRALVRGGIEGVVAFLAEVERGLRAAMVLAGCASVRDLRSAPLLRSREFHEAVTELRGFSAQGPRRWKLLRGRVAGRRRRGQPRRKG